MYVVNPTLNILLVGSIDNIRNFFFKKYLVASSAKEGIPSLPKGEVNLNINFQKLYKTTSYQCELPQIEIIYTYKILLIFINLFPSLFLKDLKTLNKALKLCLRLTPIFSKSDINWSSLSLYHKSNLNLFKKIEQYVLKGGAVNYVNSLGSKKRFKSQLINKYNYLEPLLKKDSLSLPRKNIFYYNQTLGTINTYFSDKINVRQNDNVSYSNTNIMKYLDLSNLNSFDMLFLRKSKIFNKGRYSRNRQFYRTGVYWCLYLSIILFSGLYYWFYHFTVNFGFF
jgi:hypothetical protein